MWKYYQLLLNRSDEEITKMKQGVEDLSLHPMKLKKEMAFGIIQKYWSELDALEAQKQFTSLFQKKDYSQAKDVLLPIDLDNPVWIVELLKHLEAVKTSSEAKRLIESKAVVIDGEHVVDFKAEVSWKHGMIVKVGKHRIYKIG
jgi:tyrosyl-tRNA synthetase